MGGGGCSTLCHYVQVMVFSYVFAMKAPEYQQHVRETLCYILSVMTNLRYVESRVVGVVGWGGQFYTMSLCTSHGVLELLHYEGTRIPIKCQRDTVLHLICDDQLEVC